MGAWRPDSSKEHGTVYRGKRSLPWMFWRRDTSRDKTRDLDKSIKPISLFVGFVLDNTFVNSLYILMFNFFVSGATCLYHDVEMGPLRSAWCTKRIGAAFCRTELMILTCHGLLRLVATAMNSTLATCLMKQLLLRYFFSYEYELNLFVILKVHKTKD